MNLNLQVCSEHSLNELTHICLDQYCCKRLLCASCLKCQDFPHMIFVPINNFLDQENKNNKYNAGLLVSNKAYSISQIQLRAIQFKQIFQQLISDIGENLNTLGNLIIKASQDFENLLFNKKDQDSFYNLGLNHLSEVQENNLFQAWVSFKQNQSEYIKDFQDLLVQKSKEFNQKLNSQLDLIKQIQNLDQRTENSKVIFHKGFQNYCYGGIHWELQIQEFKLIDIVEQDKIIMHDGQILKVQKYSPFLSQNIQNSCIETQITKNLDLMKNQQSFLLKSDSNLKSTQLQQIWKGENINIGGFVDEKHKKIGFWIEFFESFWERSKIISFGNYFKGKKVQKWAEKYVEIEINKMADDEQDNQQTDQYEIQNQLIGGGCYLEDGCKHGKWIDLYQNYNNQNPITYVGEYRQGNKLGLWNIMFKDKLIGGGCYDQQGREYGKWINLQKKFNQFAQVIYVGNYQHGQKYDQWNAMFRKEASNEFQIVGGGQYNLKGNKEGKWTELSPNYQNNLDGKIIGSYTDGKKEGKWEIIVENEIIGGGNYNNNGLKQGNWIDLMVNFNQSSQVIYFGEYKEGIKVGNWDTLYRWNSSHQFRRIGGGKYNKLGQKKGKWIDIHQQFWNWMPITQVGGYYKGQKVGKWDIIYEDKVIGGGLYNQDEIKIGKWIDLYESYNKTCLLSFTGEYIIGQKFGTWETKQENQIIGGGVFNSEGKKSGFWIDLHENFNTHCQVIYQGNYENGVKQGGWDIIYQKNKIGGGSFDENGRKFGQWIDLDPKFNDSWIGSCKTVYIKEYENGLLKSLVSKQEID